MKDEKTFRFLIKVVKPDDSTVIEEHSVVESDTQFGESLACGKVVSFYEELRTSGKIKDYRLMYN